MKPILPMSNFLDKVILTGLVACLVVTAYSQFCPVSNYNLEKKAAKVCHDKGGVRTDGQCILAFPLD
jgi:hypothetical protein